ncbi:MAG: hypothetical protein ACK5Z5_09720 [Neisseriaceae bacterium]
MLRSTFIKICIGQIQVIMLLCFTHSLYARTIRIAILDNPLPKWTSSQYQKYYMNGVQIGINEAKNYGIYYQTKVFTYKYPAINIFPVVKKIESWNPDVVIGPRVSEDFLLLKNQFKNTLVLSPYATSNSVYSMPSNFYSLAVSASFSAGMMGKYIKNSFKPNIVYIFTDVACKTCADFAKSLTLYLVNNGISYTNIKFIDDNILNKKIDYKDIFKNYSLKDAIVLNCTGYSAGLLIAEISNSIKQQNIYYFGGDGWGTYRDWDIAKIDTKYKYHAIRITPKSINSNDNGVKTFIIQYKKLYSSSPDAISYITYNTIQSITDAVENYNCSLANERANVLCSYESAAKSSVQWHRPVTHEIYEMKRDYESFIGDIK